jgi:hypothetical protein
MVALTCCTGDGGANTTATISLSACSPTAKSPHSLSPISGRWRVASHRAAGAGAAIERRVQARRRHWRPGVADDHGSEYPLRC